MVYIDSWDDFLEKSVLLFRSNPEKTRYAMKYRHCDGKLILKVTDDKECIKFKTDQAQDAKKMEKLNNIFFTLMAHGPEADISGVGGKEQIELSHPEKDGEGNNSTSIILSTFGPNRRTENDVTEHFFLMEKNFGTLFQFISSNVKTVL